MTKKVISNKFEQKQELKENLEIVKRALAKSILAHGQVTLDSDDWNALAPMKLAIKQEEDSIKVTVVI